MEWKDSAACSSGLEVPFIFSRSWFRALHLEHSVFPRAVFTHSSLSVFFLRESHHLSICILKCLTFNLPGRISRYVLPSHPLSPEKEETILTWVACFFTLFSNYTLKSSKTNLRWPDKANYHYKRNIRCFLIFVSLDFESSKLVKT